MVLAALLISSAAVLVALALIAGAQDAARERGRQTLEGELVTFLDGATASDAEHGKGTFEGMPVTIVLGHHEVTFSVQLPTAIVPYRELLERHGSHALKARIQDIGLTLDAKDVVSGGVPREPGLEENLVSIYNRLPVVSALHALRSHAPGELLTRLDRAHSSADIDQLLLHLTKHFPDAPETQDAIDLAAEREHGHPERVRERANRWLARA